jgi:hypothetical protein
MLDHMNAFVIASHLARRGGPGKSLREQDEFYELHGRKVGRRVIPVLTILAGTLISAMAFDMRPF